MMLHTQELFDFYLFQFDDGTFAPFELPDKKIVAYFNVYRKCEDSNEKSNI